MSARGMEQLFALAGDAGLVPLVHDPAEHVVLDRESFWHGTDKLRSQRESVDLQRHREVRPALHEASDPQFGVTLESENLDLHAVHKRVEQSAIAEFFVKRYDVDKSQRVHVGDGGRLKAEGAGLREEFRDGDARTT